MIASGSRTLVDLLRARADERPDAPAYIFLENGEVPSRPLTYGDLELEAAVIAERLTDLGVPSKRALLMYPPGLAYIAAFFGCLYAGAVAVPAYPPDPSRLERTALRLRKIARDAEISLVLTINSIESIAKELFHLAPELALVPWLATDTLTARGSVRPRAPRSAPGALALIQYTSGSTAAPKGVMISHDNLISNLAYLDRAVPKGEGAGSASWLPAYHDMGLIEGILHPIYGGYTAYLMSPAAFLEWPLRWLKAISTYGVTTSGGPNFAYDLCVRKTTEEEREGLDLRRWRVAYNGAEPVRAETLRSFLAAFGPRGFRASAFYPVYGLAEATLLVSTGGPDDEPLCRLYDARLLRSGIAKRASSGEPASEIVACGTTGLSTRVVIADPDRGCLKPDGEIGEIWIAGPGIANGYWGRPEEGERVFRATVSDTGEGPFLRSGDLGFLADGQLFITGRLKDSIILRGENHCPHDIELTAERCSPAIRPGCSAAFAITTPSGEAAALVLEINTAILPGDDQGAAMNELILAIRGAVAERHGVALHAIALIPPRTIPKTSSGKIRRAECRASLEGGALPILANWRASEDAPSKPAPSGEHAASPGRLPLESIRSWLVQSIASRAGLSESHIDARAHLSRYGLDSLASVELLTAAARISGSAMAPHALLEQPSIEAIAKLLASGEPAPLAPAAGNTRAPTSGASSNMAELTQITADMVLPVDIDPSSAEPLTAAAEPRAIFLTGVTGFLGGYLLREILARTCARVECLVRGSRARAIDTLHARGLWNEAHAPRIHFVEGDLRAPGLGLSAADRERIERESDSIYHSAASVNWVYPYADLRAVNVLSVAEILRLASSRRRKAVHFVSTIAVCHFVSAPSLALSEDTDASSLLPAMHLGYVQSKAVAEALVRSCRDRGLPAFIYRPSFIAGDSVTGASNTEDFLCALIKGCVQMGCAPDIDWTIDACPVDHAASAILSLSLHPSGSEAVLHITSSAPRPFRELVLWMNALGYPVRLVPYSIWIEELERGATDPSHALFYLRSFFSRRPTGGQGATLPELYEDGRRPIIDSRRTSAALVELGAEPSAVDARLLDKIFSSLIRQGFLSAPRAGRSVRPSSPRRGGSPLDIDTLRPILREYLEDDSIAIKQIHAEPLRTEHSLLTELASLWHDGDAGLFRLRIEYESDRNGGARASMSALLKMKARDEAVLDIGESLAGLCGPRVLRAYQEVRGVLPARGCHRRELAVYLAGKGDPRFRRNTPVLIGAAHDERRGLWALVLEHIGHFHLLDSADDTSCWRPEFIDVAIRGLAELHAIYYGLDAELVAEPLLASTSLATLAGALRMRPLWRALAEHAGPLFASFYGDEFRAVHQALAEEVERWWPPLGASPRTLIHNDFNPRNIAIRPARNGEGLRLCAYDWELAAVGAPQRDLAELLCFVLRPDADAEAIKGWVDLHCAELERASGAAIDRESYWIGFRAALAELLVDRLSIYSMAHAGRRLRFLPRVIATWRALYERAGAVDPSRP